MLVARNNDVRVFIRRTSIKIIIIRNASAQLCTILLRLCIIFGNRGVFKDDNLVEESKTQNPAVGSWYNIITNNNNVRTSRTSGNNSII